MKTFPLILALTALTFFHATAQVSVEITTDQDAFLPSESVPLAVKITNRSGQKLYFGADNTWLKFNVESVDNIVVQKIAEVPVQGEFDLESSQLAIKRVDIAPYFSLGQPGRYRVTATLFITNWGATITSPAKNFEVIGGAKIWSQDFGVPATSGVPEMRRYTLIQANYLREQLRLYLQVSDTSEARVFKVSSIGPMVAFGRPEAQIDRFSRLNVLWQTGGQSFSYSIIDPDGKLLKRDIYDTFNGRPKLKIGDDGEIFVSGGTRRIPASEIPPTPPVVPVDVSTNAVPAAK